MPLAPQSRDDADEIIRQLIEELEAVKAVRNRLYHQLHGRWEHATTRPLLCVKCQENVAAQQ